MRPCMKNRLVAVTDTKQVNTHTGKGKGQTGRPLAQAPRLRGPAPVPQVAKPGERETASPEVECA